MYTAKRLDRKISFPSKNGWDDNDYDPRDHGVDESSDGVIRDGHDSGECLERHISNA